MTPPDPDAPPPGWGEDPWRRCQTEDTRLMDGQDRTLAELERERSHLQQQIYQFVEGLHATWERPTEEQLSASASDEVLSEWVASQAEDLGALRDSIHHLRSLLLSLDEAP